jgi:EF-hand domain pair/EF hand
MMMKFAPLLGGSLLALAVATPLMAEYGGRHGGRHNWMNEPQTRAQAAAKVKTYFSTLDSNGDGIVTQSEAASAIAEKREARRDDHFTAMDTNKDGSISRAEFDAGHLNGPEMRSGTHQRNRHHGDMKARRGNHGKMLLQQADANRDGKVTLSEMTDNTLSRFDQVDANKDGTVTPAERRARYKSLRTY